MNATEVSEDRVKEALKRHKEVVGCYDASRQPDRPPVREATATVLRDAVELCRRRGRSRRWALCRIAREADVRPDTVEKWLQRGVPRDRRRGALWRGAQRAVHEAGMRCRLGEDLRDVRERLGLRQVDLAHKIGVQAATYSDWERGRCQPSAKNLEKLESTIKTLLKEG